MSKGLNREYFEQVFGGNKSAMEMVSLCKGCNHYFLNESIYNGLCPDCLAIERREKRLREACGKMAIWITKEGVSYFDKEFKDSGKKWWVLKSEGRITYNRVKEFFNAIGVSFYGSGCNIPPGEYFERDTRINVSKNGKKAIVDKIFGYNV